MADYEPPLSEAEREEIVQLYEDLRVTDVSDGLDFYGFGHDLNRVAPEIRPLHRDLESFDHRIVGFAHTMRFLPTNRRRNLPDELGFDPVTEWRDDLYEEEAMFPHDEVNEQIREHDVIVCESHDISAGIFGSMNTLDLVAEGAVGLVTDSGPRDTDEMLIQDIPVYSKTITKTITPGRTIFDDTQIPVNIAGTLIRPEDVVVADGDGVVVVPVEFAKRVGEAASEEQEVDQEHRRAAYERAGLEPDFTLE